jgi:acetyl esterase
VTPSPAIDRISGLGVRALLALPPTVQRAIGGRAIEVDGQRLEPEIQLSLRVLDLFGHTGLETLPVPEARAQIRTEAEVFGGALPEVAEVRDLEVAGAAGPLRGRLVVPRGVAGPSGLLLYLHGGGWVTGDLDTHERTCRFLAREAGVRALAVEYRLAPEDRFPAAVDDALAAFRWAVAEAEALGADPARVAVGGDSAGGNLSAAVARLTALDGGPAPVLQLLIYPVCDLSRKHPSYRLFSEGFFLTEAEMDWYRGHYLGSTDDALDPRASPLLAPEEELAGVAPAHVAVAGFDPLRDEGIAYARRLERAGVPVALQQASGLVHGFANATSTSRASRAAMGAAAAALRAATSPEPAPWDR